LVNGEFLRGEAEAKLLQRLFVPAGKPVGHRFYGLAFAVQHQPAQVHRAPMPTLRTAENEAKSFNKVFQTFPNSVKLSNIYLIPPFKGALYIT